MSRINKILYLIGVPFNRRDYERFGFDVFIRAGFEVIVWDFSPFLYPTTYQMVSPPDPISYENLIRFKHKRDAVAAIKQEESNTFVINILSFSMATFHIFKAISQKKIPYALITANAYPSANRNINFKNRIKKILNFRYKELFNALFMKISGTIPLHFLKIRPATFVLAGGEKSLPRSPLTNSDTKILWIHTFDYDIFLEDTKRNHPKENSLVFLDEYLPFHPDFTFFGLTSPISPETYYPVLCRFFDHLEKKFGMEVIIAANPRSHYEKKEDLFGGRKVERGKTAELVRDAKLVILHCSNAINFPALYRKPMIFVTTDSIERTRFRSYMDIFASYFKKTPINISNRVDIDVENELRVFEEGYTKYKHDYIKLEDTEERPFWQVVSKEIKSANV
jgi:hypothetical protein